MIERWISWAPYFRSLLRFFAGLIFIQLGLAKLFAIPTAIVPGGGTLPLATLGGFGSALELMGGVLILVGLFTRPVAFILSGEMAVAYFIGHAGPGGYWLWPAVNFGHTAVIFCFVYLYLSAAGGGPWSLDRYRQAATADPALNPAYHRPGL